tara:strand:+ start:244 stop:531 length:288 start_codon:yes stop_codon:yes gene_type:complete
MDVSYDRLPDHMRESAQAFVERGRRPGHFLSALFSNNLMETFARADDVNIAALGAWTKFLYNDAPSQAWGSSEKFEAWIAVGGLRGHLTLGEKNG